MFKTIKLCFSSSEEFSLYEKETNKREKDFSLKIKEKLCLLVYAE